MAPVMGTVSCFNFYGHIESSRSLYTGVLPVNDCQEDVTEELKNACAWRWPVHMSFLQNGPLKNPKYFGCKNVATTGPVIGWTSLWHTERRLVSDILHKATAWHNTEFSDWDGSRFTKTVIICLVIMSHRYRKEESVPICSHHFSSKRSPAKDSFNIFFFYLIQFLKQWLQKEEAF